MNDLSYLDSNLILTRWLPDIKQHVLCARDVSWDSNWKIGIGTRTSKPSGTLQNFNLKPIDLNQKLNE